MHQIGYLPKPKSMFWSLITFRGMWTFSQSLIFNVHKVHMWTFSQKTMKMFKKFTYELFRCLYNTGTMGTYARSHPKFFQYYISKNIQFAKFIWIKREGLCQNQIQLFLLRMKIYKQTKAKKIFRSGVPKNSGCADKWKIIVRGWSSRSLFLRLCYSRCFWVPRIQ